MYKCKQCEREFDSPKQLAGHVRAMIKKDLHIKLTKEPENKVDDKYKIADNLYKCPHCEKTFTKQGLGSHIWRSHGSGINFEANKNRDYTTFKIWNKGLTKDTDDRVNQSSKTLIDNFKTGKVIPSFLGKKHTKASLDKIAENGGYRKGSGRGKSGWYKNYWCDSTWELAWIIYQLDHNIKFERNKKGFTYEFENKSYKYYPDFILEDKTYIEIKGYLDNKNKEKINQFPHSLKIIMKEEIKKYLKYATDKYGNDLTVLYTNVA